MYLFMHFTLDCDCVPSIVRQKGRFVTVGGGGGGVCVRVCVCVIIDSDQMSSSGH